MRRKTLPKQGEGLFGFGFRPFRFWVYYNHSGGARGADSLAGEWARDRNQRCIVVPADWESYGKRAGYIRNSEMVSMGFDLLIAFPGGPGTAMMTDLTRRSMIPVRVIVD